MDRFMLSTAVAIVGLAAIFLFNFGLPTGKVIAETNATVCFEENCLMCEIADEANEQAIGLMYKDSLPENECMLFVFQNEGYHDFWMRNVKFPLDIIWISSGMEVVQTEHAGTCFDMPCSTHGSTTPAIYVVETNFGFTEKNNITVANKVSITFG